MRSNKQFILAVCLLTSAFMETAFGQNDLAVPAATGKFPAWVRYTGVLSGQESQTVNLTFAIYKDPQGGQALWQESQNVDVDLSSHYSALLGFASPEGLPPSIFSSSDAQWLGVRINNGPEPPRALLVSVPYAMKAKTADRLAGFSPSDFVLRSELPQLLQNLGQQAASAGPTQSAPPSSFLAQSTSVSNPTTAMQSNSSTDVLMVEQDGVGYALHTIGTTNSAIFAETKSQTSSNFTVLSLNHAPGGTAVRAEAQADTGRGFGVWGSAYGDTGTGVLGDNPRLTGSTYGVRGKALSSAGIGVFGANLSSVGTTTGIRGETWSPSGTAGVFDALGGGNILSGRSSGAEKFRVDSFGNVTAAGAVSAAALSGDGSRLTNVNATTLNGFPASAFIDVDQNGEQSLNSNRLLINSAPSASSQFGFAGILRDDLDTVHSYIGQAGSQLHFRLSRVAPDNNGAQHFLITPYQWGVALEYPGVIEAWSKDFSIHTNPYGQGGARFWVGDDMDVGGLFVTARINSLVDTGSVTLAADKFTHASHGSMNFVTRNLNDSFRFNNGSYGQETMFGQVFKTQSTSNIEAYSGSLTASLLANNAQSAVQVGSRSASRVDIITADSAPQLSVFPSGNVSIGNTADTAPLTVGPTAQFQVNAAGAVTIGGGTPIAQHISITAGIVLTSLFAATCQVTTVAVTGVSDGDTVALGVPNSLASAGDLTLFGWVSAPDNVSIRACNMGAAGVDSAAGTVRVDVWKH